MTAERSPPEFTDHWSQFAGDCRFVDRGHSLDHFAVGWDHVAGFHEHKVAHLEVRAGHEPVILLVARTGDQLGLSLGALAPQRIGLGLAAALGNGFGEIRKQHGEPQPHNDLKLKTDLSAAGEQITNEDHGGEYRDNLKHEHHRIFD